MAKVEVFERYCGTLAKGMRKHPDYTARQFHAYMQNRGWIEDLAVRTVQGYLTEIRQDFALGSPLRAISDCIDPTAHNSSRVIASRAGKPLEEVEDALQKMLRYGWVNKVNGLYVLAQKIPGPLPPARTSSGTQRLLKTMANLLKAGVTVDTFEDYTAARNIKGSAAQDKALKSIEDNFGSYEDFRDKALAAHAHNCKSVDLVATLLEVVHFHDKSRPRVPLGTWEDFVAIYCEDALKPEDIERMSDQIDAWTEHGLFELDEEGSYWTTPMFWEVFRFFKPTGVFPVMTKGTNDDPLLPQHPSERDLSRRPS